MHNGLESNNSGNRFEAPETIDGLIAAFPPTAFCEVLPTEYSPLEEHCRATSQYTCFVCQPHRRARGVHTMRAVLCRRDGRYHVICVSSEGVFCALNFTVTASEQRLLGRWLARPFYIDFRQNEDELGDARSKLQRRANGQ